VVRPRVVPRGRSIDRRVARVGSLVLRVAVRPRGVPRGRSIVRRVARVGSLAPRAVVHPRGVRRGRGRPIVQPVPLEVARARTWVAAPRGARRALGLVPVQGRSIASCGRPRRLGPRVVRVTAGRGTRVVRRPGRGTVPVQDATPAGRRGVHGPVAAPVRVEARLGAVLEWGERAAIPRLPHRSPGRAADPHAVGTAMDDRPSAPIRYSAPCDSTCSRTIPGSPASRPRPRPRGTC
jgi:hypothetical protein